jgi:hypothetical protein
VKWCVKEAQERKYRGDVQEPDWRRDDRGEERARNLEDPNHQARRFVNSASTI